MFLLDRVFFRSFRAALFLFLSDSVTFEDTPSGHDVVFAGARVPVHSSLFFNTSVIDVKSRALFVVKLLLRLLLPKCTVFWFGTLYQATRRHIPEDTVIKFPNRTSLA